MTNPNLKKLYLEDNFIEVVAGLEECSNLEELHVARQKLPVFQSLQFDNYSLHNLSRSLLVIDVSGNNITTLHPFVTLRALEKFFCTDNSVVDLNEIKIIVSLPNLQEAKFTNNPVTQYPKYRDFAIGISNRNFYKLDDVEIPRHQQEAMKGLMQHRQKLGVMNRLFTEQRKGNRISTNNLHEESSSLSIHNNPIKHINQVQGYNSQDDTEYHNNQSDNEE